MVGRNYHALKMPGSFSPKLRIPNHAHVFDGFSQVNKVDTEDFIAVGSLAAGGLSNAWGCGVSQLTGKDFEAYPFNHEAMARSYSAVIERIGISGPKQDDLSEYFGLVGELQPPIPIDELHLALFKKYGLKRSKLIANGFLLGRFLWQH